MISRNRRLRTNDSIRSLVRETSLTTNDLVLPMFVTEGDNKKKPYHLCQAFLDKV